MSLGPRPHHSRCDQSDLMALVRLWQWEETVRRRLDDVLHGDGLSVAYQPIYRLHGPLPVVGGYEAFARFPRAPEVPTRLWFRVAAEEGVGIELERTAARRALASATVLRPLFLAINSSPAALETILELLAGRPTAHLVELSHIPNVELRTFELISRARSLGIGIAIDDVPLSELHELEDDLVRLRPDMVKVDLLGGLIDEPMARFNLASGVAWCTEAGIELVAERVERARDVEVLVELGVGWAQGYGLSRPQATMPDPVEIDSAAE